MNKHFKIYESGSEASLYIPFITLYSYKQQFDSYIAECNRWIEEPIHVSAAAVFESFLKYQEDHWIMIVDEIDNSAGKSAGKGICVGFIHFTAYSDFDYVNYLFVNPDYQKQGFGRKLFELIKTNRKLVLSCLTANKSVQSFYEHLGFQKADWNKYEKDLIYISDKFMLYELV